MKESIPKNLTLPDGGDENGLMPILWQRVADFGGKFFETPNGMVERKIDDIILYTAWMASCHVGAASVDEGWSGFSLRKMPREARDVLMMTRYYIREALAGFSGDVNKYFAGSVGVRESGPIADKFGDFFSGSFKTGLDVHVRRLLDQKRQIVLQEDGVENKIKGSSDDELKKSGVVLQEIIDVAVKKIEAILFSAAHHVGIGVMDVDKCADASNFVELFCYDAVAGIQRNSQYDVFFPMVLSWFIDSGSLFYEFVMTNDETIWGKEQKQSAWYLQFETAMSGLYKLFRSAVQTGEGLDSESFPDPLLRAKTERILREIFQSLKTGEFLVSANELGRQIDLANWAVAGAGVGACREFVRDGSLVIGATKDFDMFNK